MSNDPKLSLLNTPKEVQPRNYWNTSGKNREFFPTEPLPNSIPIFNKQGRIIEEPTNEWWINSATHHYCFWSYLKEKSQPDGAMEPLLQSEIAKLMGCSVAKLHSMLHDAMAALTSEENLKVLESFEELTIPEPQDDFYGSDSFGDLDSDGPPPENEEE
jgi:hypothetical protein